MAISNMLSLPLGGLVSEMKQHPWTTLIAIVAIALASYNFTYNARAAELLSVKNSVNEILTGQIEGRLVDARIRYCHALRESSQDGVSYYQQQVLDFQSRYRKSTGRDYQLPSCSDT